MVGFSYILYIVLAAGYDGLCVLGFFFFFLFFFFFFFGVWFFFLFFFFFLSTKLLSNRDAALPQLRSFPSGVRPTIAGRTPRPPLPQAWFHIPGPGFLCYALSALRVAFFPLFRPILLS